MARAVVEKAGLLKIVQDGGGIRVTAEGNLAPSIWLMALELAKLEILKNAQLPGGLEQIVRRVDRDELRRRG
jgi:hypothetical protein